ncbi:MAG TPA: hypothetical protein VGL71_12090 [Urbifossiella sp.]
MRAHRKPPIRLELFEDRLTPSPAVLEPTPPFPAVPSNADPAAVRQLKDFDTVGDTPIAPLHGTDVQPGEDSRDNTAGDPLFILHSMPTNANLGQMTTVILLNENSPPAQDPSVDRTVANAFVSRATDPTIASPSIVLDADRRLTDHDRLLGLPPSGESESSGGQNASTNSPGGWRVSAAQPIFLAAHVPAAPSAKSDEAGGMESGIKSPVRISLRFTKPAESGAEQAEAPVAAGDACVPVVLPVEPVSIVEELAPVVTLFPEGVPLAGIIIQNLNAIEESARTLLAELPVASCEMIDSLNDPENYLWLSATILVSSTAVFMVRGHRSRSKDRVILGTDSVLVRPEEKLRVRGILS